MNSQNRDIFADHFVNVRGYNTRYWDVGFSDSVVVLVHGFALSCEVWEQNIKELSKSHRVIALDFWGAGKTDATANKLSLHDYPEFLIWFLEVLNIKKAKFVGHSLGGLLTMRLAHNHPEYVEKLMLVGSAGFNMTVPLHFRLMTLPFLGEWLIKPNKQNLHHAFKYNLHQKNVVSKKYIDALYEYSLKPHAPKHALNMARSGIGFLGFKRKIMNEIHTEIKHIQCPVMVVWGRNDRILHHRGALKAKKLIPHAQIEILESCGHLPQVEHPKRFNEIADRFLGAESQ